VKKWNQSKVMIVGEGRTGKTSLVNSVMGNPAVSPESTCGIGQYSVYLAGKDGGEWRRHDNDTGFSFVDAVAEVAKQTHLHERELSKAALKAGSIQSSNAVAIGSFRNIVSRVSSAAGPAVKERVSSSSEAAAISVNAQLPVRDGIDMAPVLQQYYRRLSQISDVVVKLFDLGGQEVFDCVHTYFMTERAIYVVVFNMVRVVDVATRSSSLTTLSFWMDAVASKSPGCVFIVGSHMDLIVDEEQHQYISELLLETFRLSEAWPVVVFNNSLTFFPVNNNLGIEDSAVRNLILKMEDKIQQSDVVKTLVPFAWYRALDKLESLPPIIPYAVAHAAAVSCGVAEDTVCDLLAFLRDMGSLMWYNEGCLKDYVIINAVDAFVTPITRIICQTGVHNNEARARCKQMNEEAFELMVARGIVDAKLLTDLLNYGPGPGFKRFRGHAMDHQTEFIVALAAKYRLLVPWESVGGSPQYYFVPSLFARCGTGSLSNIEAGAVGPVYFRVSLRKSTVERVSGVARKKGFLPHGLFDRMMCIVLEWAQLTPDNDPSTFELFRDGAVLRFANTKFCLRCMPCRHCIRLTAVDGGTPCTLVKRLNGCLSTAIRECSQSLAAEVCLLVDDVMMPICTDSFQPCAAALQQNGIDVAVVLDHCPWMQAAAARSDQFDVFISYRWGLFECPFVIMLEDLLADYVVDARGMTVFLDKEVIKGGNMIPKIYFEGLWNTALVLPIVTPLAIRRMLTENHDGTEVDHVLGEWLIASVLVRYGECFEERPRLRTVYPIFIEGNEGDQDYRLSLRDISNSQPTATIRLVLDLFEQRWPVLPSKVVEFIEKCTVKSIVASIRNFDGLNLVVQKCDMETAAADLKPIISQSIRAVWKVFQGCSG
jgi:GTPase SAR1 family protein